MGFLVFCEENHCFDPYLLYGSAHDHRIEKEYFLAYWGESYGYYLVACTDPDVAPQDIVEHYKDYLEAVRFD